MQCPAKGGQHKEMTIVVTSVGLISRFFLYHSGAGM
jgi:hypothetical protein